jgi:hypothetical protein
MGLTRQPENFQSEVKRPPARQTGIRYLAGSGAAYKERSFAGWVFDSRSYLFGLSIARDHAKRQYRLLQG